MPKEERNPFALYCDDESLTQQNFAAECDINTIVKRASVGAEVTHVNPRAPMYGDFTAIPNYQEAFDVVRRANDLFMTMTWDVRERFGNDPSRMLQFLQDPKNQAEAIRMGLMAPKPGYDKDGRKLAKTPSESNPDAPSAPSDSKVTKAKPTESEE